MMTKLYPGFGGIGSGVGFEVNGVDLKVSALYDHAQVLQRPNGLEQWGIFFRETNALMFVMDMCGDTVSVKRDLEILSHPLNGIAPSTPVVVLACTHTESEEEKSSMKGKDFFDLKPVKIAELLDLDTLKRPWFVQKVDIGSLSGVYDGFDWIISVV